MACDNRTRVYLGYEDEYVTDKHRSLLNFTTNKIGGHPVSREREAHLRGNYPPIAISNFFIRSICNSLNIQQNVKYSI